jgi:membrane associated rhomboid family serine protease
MGIADREYVRTPTSAPPVGVVRMWSVTTWLIVINVAVFVLNETIGQLVTIDGQRFLIRPIAEWGYFSIFTAIQRAQVWRFITFQFLHGGLAHLLFNMFSLYFFGPLIEGYLGRRRFLSFYLLSGIGGPIAYVLLWSLGVWGTSVPSTVPLIGASAGVFGVLIAAATIAPNATVLIYGSIPAKLKTVAWVLIAIALLTVFGRGYNAGGEAAHLGGAAVGFLLIRKPQWLNVFEIGYQSGRPRVTYR